MTGGTGDKPEAAPEPAHDTAPAKPPPPPDQSQAGPIRNDEPQDATPQASPPQASPPQDSARDPDRPTGDEAVTASDQGVAPVLADPEPEEPIEPTIDLQKREAPVEPPGPPDDGQTAPPDPLASPTDPPASPARQAAPATGPERSLAVWHWPGLLALYALVVALGLDRTALTGLEATVAGLARVMAIDGTWIIPHLGDAVVLDPAPLGTWLTAAAIGLFGAEAWVARLPSVILGFFVVAATAFAIARATDRQTGLLAGVILATSAGFVATARSADAGMLATALAIGVGLCVWGLATPQPPGRTRRLLLALGVWGLTALSALAGPPWLAPLAILVALGLVILARQDWTLARRLADPPALIAGAVVLIAWPVAVVIAGEHAALWTALTGHFTAPADPVAWFTRWAVATLPWLPVLPIGVGIAVVSAVRNRTALATILLVWGTAGLAVSILASAGLGLPLALPALAALMALGARWLADHRPTLGPRTQRRVAQGIGVLAWLALLCGVAIGFAAPDVTFGLWALGAVAWLALLAIALAVLRGRTAAVAAVLTIAVAATYGLLHSPISPLVSDRETDRALLDRVRTDVGPDETVIITGPDAARAIFQIGPPVRVIMDSANARAAMTGEAAPVVAPFAAITAWDGVCVDWLDVPPDTAEPLTGGPHRLGLATVRIAEPPC